MKASDNLEQKITGLWGLYRVIQNTVCTLMSLVGLDQGFTYGRPTMA